MTDAQKLSLGDALDRLEAWREEDLGDRWYSLMRYPSHCWLALRDSYMGPFDLSDLPAAVTRAIENFERDGGK